ncbi:MAG TPA: phosphopentomutase [Erysipelotrichaceae bacterium]|nr:phosphopentomutase [Erysipelotrichaceae bacterium]
MSNYRYKRIFVIVADSMGTGYMKDAFMYNDEGANTLLHIGEKMPNGLTVPCLNKLGIGDLDPIKGTSKVSHPHSYVAKANAISKGKDTMTGHWEIMGVNTVVPFKTFTDTGFPPSLIQELEQKTGYKIIGNKAASGTEILKELGEEQCRDNSLIVYTSSDSVLQIAAHEEVTGLEELYRCCQIAREICMKPEWMVGRIIARPYVGTNKDNFKRVTSHRHDLALKPSVPTVMNILENHGFVTSCIGKIGDIFSHYGVTKSQNTVSNEDGMDKTIKEAKEGDFTGICFVNLVEFDSEYGHRRDPIGYGKCIERFDRRVAELLPELKNDDLLIITADHGNDPTWLGTDHTREKIPLIIYNRKFKNGRYLPERQSFADIGATILKNFHLEKPDYLLGEPIVELFD